MRILFFYYSMHFGGAERMISLLANSMAEHGNAVEIVTMNGEASFYPLASSVRYVPMNIAKNSSGCIDAVRNNLRALRTIRQTFSAFRPDVVLCFSTEYQLRAWLARGLQGYCIIGSERANPYSQPKGIWSVIRKPVSMLCDGFIFQTVGVQALFPKAAQHKSIVLHNMVDTAQFQAAELPWAQRSGLCAVGRMDAGKCFDDLLRALALVVKRHPQAHLDLFGDGAERQNLERLAQELGLTESVSFHGRSQTVLQEYARHKIFVMTSRSEGMPNVLLEAMASGCACVSTDCDFGPSDLIVSGENGFLVPVHDVEAIAGRICALLEDDGLCEQLGCRARAIRETHDTACIGDQFYRYLEQRLQER